MNLVYDRYVVYSHLKLLQSEHILRLVFAFVMTTCYEEVVVYSDSHIQQINERLTSVELWITHILAELEKKPAKKPEKRHLEIISKLDAILSRLPVQGMYIFYITILSLLL